MVIKIFGINLIISIRENIIFFLERVLLLLLSLLNWLLTLERL